jgi:hypothetical protein
VVGCCEHDDDEEPSSSCTMELSIQSVQFHVDILTGLLND